MKCVLTISSIFVILLSTFLFVSEIDCCSDNVADPIYFVDQDPELEFDPCIWKATHDAKIDELNRKGNNLEKHIGSDQEERDIYMPSYAPYTGDEISTSTWTIIGVFCSVFFMTLCAIICCFEVYILFVRGKNARNVTRNTTQNDINSDEITVVSPAPWPFPWPRSVYAHQSNANTDINMTTFRTEGQESNQLQRDRDSTRHQSASSVPLSAPSVPLSAMRVNRQTSLPSYDDAMKMKSPLEVVSE